MQAIILAAGLGKRLGNLTLNNTKCMVKVNGIPLIERMLRQLEKLNLEKIVLVIGYEGEKLKAFSNSLNLNTRLEYVTNEVYDKTNNIYSLYLAKETMLSGATLLLEADLVFEDALLEKLMADPSPDLALVSQFEEWMDGTCVKIDSDNNILKFVPKKEFVYEEAGSYYKTVNIYKFSKEFLTNHYVPFLEAYMKACGLNDYYEQVLRITSYLDKPMLKALPLDGEKWYEIDNLEDLNIAETIIDSPAGRLEKTAAREGGMWRFPRVTDFSVSFNAGFPGSRMLSEIRVNTDILLRSVPSSRPFATLLAAKYFNTDEGLVCVAAEAEDLLTALLSHTTGTIGALKHSLTPSMLNRFGDRLRAFDPGAGGFTADDMIAFCSAYDIKILYTGAPDSLSGSLADQAGFRKLLDHCSSEGIRLIADTSYSDFSGGSGGHSYLFSNSVLGLYPGLAVIYDFSCAGGVTGLRVAALGSADTELTGKIQGALPEKAFGSFAEFYLQITGKYEGDYNRSCKEFITERERFSHDLSKQGVLSVLSSGPAVLICKVRQPFTASSLARKLLSEHEILVGILPGSEKDGGAEFIRIGVRSRGENEKLTAILAAIDKE